MDNYTNIKSRLKEKTPFTNILNGELMNEALEAINELCAENERLRLELDMAQATILVPSQKDDRRTIERLRAENERLRSANAAIEKMLREHQHHFMRADSERIKLRIENEQLKAYNQQLNMKANDKGWRLMHRS